MVPDKFSELSEVIKRIKAFKSKKGYKLPNSHCAQTVATSQTTFRALQDSFVLKTWYTLTNLNVVTPDGEVLISRLQAGALTALKYRKMFIVVLVFRVHLQLKAVVVLLQENKIFNLPFKNADFNP